MRDHGFFPPDDHAPIRCKLQCGHEDSHLWWAAPVERADIPLETYWTDRTAALAEALRRLHDNVCNCPFDGTDDGCNFRLTAADAKDALLYLREHGWTLEREER